jgi:hypothetical protein
MALETTDSLYAELERELGEIAQAEGDLLRRSEKSVVTVLSTISRLKQWVLDHAFPDTREEIRFFKEIKPRFFALLIYHNGVFDIETHRPVGGGQALRAYLEKELGKLDEFFAANADFQRYLRTNATYLDEKYFLRGTHDVTLALDSFVFDADPRFSTSRDHNAARMIANERLAAYLEAALAELEARKAGRTGMPEGGGLDWKLSKTSCIELLYALHSVGAFGKTDVKRIASHFESAFNIDLKNYYHTFLEIRIRKTSRAAFLELLREKLIQRMDDADDNPR